MKKVVSNSNQFTESNEMGQFAILTFRLEGQLYGLPITAVNQIIELVAITRIPQVPPAVQGVINVHGSIVPVIDLRKRFNLPLSPYHLHTPLILADVNGRTIALVVDEVEEVVEIQQQLAPDSMNPDLIMGTVNVKQQLIPLLNVQQILSQEEKDRLCQILSANSLTRPTEVEKQNGQMRDFNP